MTTRATLAPWKQPEHYSPAQVSLCKDRQELKTDGAAYRVLAMRSRHAHSIRSSRHHRRYVQECRDAGLIRSY